MRRLGRFGHTSGLPLTRRPQRTEEARPCHPLGRPKRVRLGGCPRTMPLPKRRGSPWSAPHDSRVPQDGVNASVFPFPSLPKKDGTYGLWSKLKVGDQWGNTSKQATRVSHRRAPAMYGVPPRSNIRPSAWLRPSLVAWKAPKRKRGDDESVERGVGNAPQVSHPRRGRLHIAVAGWLRLTSSSAFCLT